MIKLKEKKIKRLYQFIFRKLYQNLVSTWNIVIDIFIKEKVLLLEKEE